MPTKDEGLYINLSTFVAVGMSFGLDMKRSKVEEQLYLNGSKPRGGRREEDSKTQKLDKKLKQTTRSVNQWVSIQETEKMQRKTESRLVCVLSWHRLWSRELSIQGYSGCSVSSSGNSFHHDSKKDELKEFHGEDEIIVSNSRILSIRQRCTNFTWSQDVEMCWQWYDRESVVESFGRIHRIGT